MAELPQGTVTFLFTDIEGSTRLLNQLGDRYSSVLDEHRRILREAVEGRDGREVDTQGDSFFFAFARANAALGAAVRRITRSTVPRLPASLPDRSTTVSPFRISGTFVAWPWT